MPEIELDPYTKLHTALLDMITSQAAFVEAVKSSNIIGFESDARNPRAPIRDNVQAGNLPECMLIAMGSPRVNLHATSSSSSVTRQYTFVIATGDLRITNTLFPVEFAVYCAATKWKAYLGQLTWQNEHFVKKLDIVKNDIGMSDEMKNRGIKGWSTAITFEIDLYFNTLKMQGAG